MYRHDAEFGSDEKAIGQDQKKDGEQAEGRRQFGNDLDAVRPQVSGSWVGRGAPGPRPRAWHLQAAALRARLRNACHRHPRVVRLFTYSWADKKERR